jgi:hypothetical protein
MWYVRHSPFEASPIRVIGMLQALADFIDYLKNTMTPP